MHRVMQRCNGGLVVGRGTRRRIEQMCQGGLLVEFLESVYGISNEDQLQSPREDIYVPICKRGVRYSGILLAQSTGYDARSLAKVAAMRCGSGIEWRPGWIRGLAVGEKMEKGETGWGSHAVDFLVCDGSNQVPNASANGHS